MLAQLMGDLENARSHFKGGIKFAARAGDVKRQQRMEHALDKIGREIAEPSCAFRL